MDRIATTAGLFPPLSDAEDPYRRAIERQRSAGLDRVGTGQCDWADGLAHPLSVHDAVEFDPQTPPGDGEDAPRTPVVTAELSFDGTMAAELDRLADRTASPQAVVPGPYTLATLARDEHYGDPAEFLAAMEAFLATEVAAFPDAETLFLWEPALVADPPGDGEDARASDAIDGVVDATEAAVVVHLPGGAPAEKVHAHLLDAGMDAVGYDFAREASGNLTLVNEYGTTDDVALALVDGRNPTVETPDLIHERVEWFLDTTPPVVDFETIYVTTNTELRSLPWETVGRKLDALGEAVTLDLAD